MLLTATPSDSDPRREWSIWLTVAATPNWDIITLSHPDPMMMIDDQYTKYQFISLVSAVSNPFEIRNSTWTKRYLLLIWNVWNGSVFRVKSQSPSNRLKEYKTVLITFGSKNVSKSAVIHCGSMDFNLLNDKSTILSVRLTYSHMYSNECFQCSTSL